MKNKANLHERVKKTLPIAKINFVEKLYAPNKYPWVEDMADNNSRLIRHARVLVSDLLEPTPSIYWSDFLISITAGYFLAGIYLSAESFSARQIICLVGGAIFIYRTSIFMHEIAHFRRGEMTSFKIAWNLLAGIPMLTPSFFYESHRDHHNTRTYGTDHDGEYLGLGRGTLTGVLLFLGQVFILPIMTASRFLIFTPLSFVIPSLRKWLLAHWSSFVINFRYERTILDRDPKTLWGLIEVACFLRVATLVALAFTTFGVEHLIKIYALAVTVLLMNHIRTLAAHRYLGGGDAMSHEDQLLDSTDIVGDSIFTEALCPVGTRYHALHHLFPAMPYHNLQEAHLRLQASLPPDSGYHRCIRPSLFHAIGDLIMQVWSEKNEASQSVVQPEANNKRRAA